MKAIFTAKALLSKMQWLWLILSQPYYLAARWSAVLKWIMNPWNWLFVTFIILMERQVRSGLTTPHANETIPVCLRQGIYLSVEEGDASRNWTREKRRRETNYSNHPCRNQMQIQEPILCTERLLELLNERILQAAKNQDCGMNASP